MLQKHSCPPEFRVQVVSILNQGAQVLQVLGYWCTRNRADGGSKVGYDSGINGIRLGQLPLCPGEAPDVKRIDSRTDHLVRLK